MSKNIILLGAMAQELEHYKKGLKHIRELENNLTYGQRNGQGVILALTGIGTNMAAAVTKELINEFEPQAIIFTGVGGSLDQNVKIGNVGIIEAAVNYQTDLRGFDQKYAIGQQLFQKAGTRLARADSRLLQITYGYIGNSLNSCNFFKGYSATGDQFLIADSPKVPGHLKHLTKQYFNEKIAPSLEEKVGDTLIRPNCCDMETEAIMRQANSAKVPILAFRQISDNLIGDSVIEFNEGELQKGIEKYCPIVNCVLEELGK